MEEKYTELEYKFAADHVTKGLFRAMMIDKNPLRFEHTEHDDVFWQRGDTIVRHRIKDVGELTLKERTRDDSIVDRMEINLKLAGSSSDAQAFLKAAGFRQLFCLYKDYIDIFDFERSDFKIEVALYSVARLNDTYASFGKRTFLEIEIKPGRDMSKEMAKEVLGEWADWARAQFALGPPLNFSLFEYYSQLAPPNANGTCYKI